MKHFRLFVSSPSDAMAERLIVEQTVSRLNGSYAGVARLETIRWETAFYTADCTFQAQIPDAASCDIVITIFRGRLGQPIPTDFAVLPGGEAYPSGTAYEVLTAIEAAKTRHLPDVYVFRCNRAPAPALNDPGRAAIESEWQRLSGFFERWFVNPSEGFKAAFHSYEEADEFAKKVDTLLREWLARRVLEGRSVRWPVELLGSPFRGLDSFGAKHSSVFFGRDRDSEKAVSALANAMRQGTGYLLVTGLSGAGKSSLARAGIVPRLTTPGVIPDVSAWRVASLRPGSGPLAALATKLFEAAADIPPDEQGRAQALPELKDGDYKTPAELTDLFRAPASAAIRPILTALDRVAEQERSTYGLAAAPSVKLVVIIDQLDDLFATSIPVAEREAFASILDALVRSGRAVVVATLRADLLGAYLSVERLSTLREDGAEITLAPPGPAELAEIVRGPAEAADLIFEEQDGERLDERLLKDADSADMLPLVQLALEKLFEGRVTEGKQLVLPFAAYGAGLASLIASEADAALSEAGPGAKDALKRMLRPLVERDKDGKSILKIAPRDAVARDAVSTALLKALIDGRIMLSNQDGVRIAHQRVLTDWPEAKKAITSNADYYRIRDEVSAAYRVYTKEGARKDRLLGAGKPVEDALALVRDFRDEVPNDLKAFIAASHDKARRGARLKNGAIVGLLVLSVAAIGGGVYALQLRNEALRLQDLAETRQKQAEANFDLAKNTVSSVIFDFAQGFNNVEGIRSDVLLRVLSRSRIALDRLAESVPGDISIQRLRSASLNEFGNLFSRTDTETALKIYKESLEMSRNLLIRNPNNDESMRDMSVSLSNIGDLKSRTAPLEATPFLEESLDIAKILASRHPNNKQYQIDLARAMKSIASLKANQNLKDAQTIFNSALEIEQNLARSEPHDVEVQKALISTLSSLAKFSERINKNEALRLHKEILSVRRELMNLAPEDISNRLSLIITLNTIGQLFSHRDVAQSLKYLEDGRKLISDLVALEPDNISFQSVLSENLMIIADNVMYKDKKYAESLHEKSLEIRRSLSIREPYNEGYQYDLSVSLDRTADNLIASNEAEALARYEESLKIRQLLTRVEGQNPHIKRDLAISYIKIGDIKRKKDINVAIDVYVNSYNILRNLSEKEPNDMIIRESLISSLRRVSDSLSQVNPEAAIPYYEKSIEQMKYIIKKSPNDIELILNTIKCINDAIINNLNFKKVLPVSFLQDGVSIARTIFNMESASSIDKSNVATFVEYFADVYLEFNSVDGVVLHREILEIRRLILQLEPGNDVFKRNYSISLDRMAEIYAASDANLALSLYENSLSIKRTILDSKNLGKLKSDIVISLVGIARTTSDADQRRVSFMEAVAILKDLDAKGLLQDDQKGWIGIIEAEFNE